jgi:exodeoxyribonuclease VII large subunit
LELHHVVRRSVQRVLTQVLREADRIGHLRTQVLALSPQQTLERGYAVVQHADGRVVTDREDVEADELLRVRVARGDFAVRPVTGLADGAGT